VIHNTGAPADLRDNGTGSEGNIPERSVRLSAAAQRGTMCRSMAQTMGVGLTNPLELERSYEYTLPQIGEPHVHFRGAGGLGFRDPAAL
jgi:hypothetical protein